MTKVPVYKIDKDVPVPEAPDPVELNSSMPLEDLEVGESFEFPADKRSYVQSRVSGLKRRKGLEFTVRRMDELTCRVWRIS